MVTAAEKKRREALAAKLAGKSAPADDDTLGNPADFDTDAEGSVKEEADTIVPPVDPGSGTGEVGEAAVLQAPESGRPTQESATDAPTHVAQESATDAPGRFAQESSTPVDPDKGEIFKTTIEEFVPPDEQADENVERDADGNPVDATIVRDQANVEGDSDNPNAIMVQVVESEQNRLTAKATGDAYAREMANTTPINPPAANSSAQSRREAEMNRGREVLAERHPAKRRAVETKKGDDKTKDDGEGKKS